METAKWQYSGPLIFTPNDDSRSPLSGRLIAAFFTIGLLLRFGRYLMQFPLWEDECFLCANLIDRGYAALLEPLDYHQVAPVLFLWVQLTIVKLWGYHEYALRLFPFLCSLGSLYLFQHLAKRLLSGFPLVVAVGIFAVAYPNIRYAAEAKQYASDLFVGLLVTVICIEWWRAISLTGESRSTIANRWLWALAALTPIAVGLSYPAVFPAGAASLFVFAVAICNNRTQHHTLLNEPALRPWIVFNMVLVGSFIAVLSFAARGQSDSELEWMGTYWNHAFPPIGSPLEIPGWLLEVHAGSLLAFPIGGERGASTITLISMLTGGVLMLRRQKLLALLLLSPALLHLIAAALERYPYGGHVKFSMHMGAAICLISGIGAAWLTMWIGQRFGAVRKLVAITLIYLFAIGAGSLLRDISAPYKTESDMRARAFARWFWPNASFQGEVACVQNDLNVVFTPQMHSELSWEAMYRVNKSIYGPQSEGPDLSRVSANWPLRCVVYRVDKLDFDQPQFDQWLEQMLQTYELVSTERLEFPRFGKRDRVKTRESAIAIESADVFTFVPR